MLHLALNPPYTHIYKGVIHIQDIPVTYVISQADLRSNICLHEYVHHLRIT